MKNFKNPLAYLKHLIKDPINTIAEADARKKEVMPWLLGSIALAVVPGIIMSFVDWMFLSILTLIGVLGIMLFVLVLGVIKKAKDKFIALTCDKCNTMAEIKTPEDFSKFVSYTVGEDVATYHGINHPASDNGVVSKIEATGSASAVAYIDLKCPHCGNVKKLEYHVTPFQCDAVQQKVPVRDVELVKSRLETAVKETVNDYNDEEKRQHIPYSIHSAKHPDFENRTKPQLNRSNALPKYNGIVEIKYHKDVEEMVEQFILLNQLDGTIIDPSKPKKAK